MRKNILIYILFLAIGFTIVFFMIPLGSYFVANYQYEKLVRTKPLTMLEVEKTLFLYKTKRIDIKNSLWGSNVRLERDEYCQQYLILGREPIDIVYDSDGKVKRIFSSFE